MDASGDTKRYGLGSWGKQGHCRRRREVIGGVKPAAARWVRQVRNAIQGSMRVSRSRCAPSTTSPPPPYFPHHHSCPCGECCVRQEFSTPGKVSFPAKIALVVGRCQGLCGGERAGLWYCGAKFRITLEGFRMGTQAILSTM